MISGHAPAQDFADVLRAAVSASQLTLEELADDVRRAGHRISRSSLSAWQSGRSVPTRKDALAALPCLEELLGLPAGRLTEALADPNDHRALPGWQQAHLWPKFARQLLSQLDTHPDDPAQPLRIGQRFRLAVNAAGKLELMHSATLLQGGAVTATRLVRVSSVDETPTPASFPLMYGARLGRIRVNKRAGVMAFELLLDKPLEPGEVTLVEHLMPPPHADTVWLSPPGLRELTVQVRFAAELGEPRVWLSSLPRGGSKSKTQLQGTDRNFQAVLLDPPPGSYGLEWSLDG